MLQAINIDSYITRNTDEYMGLLTRTSLINNMKCNLSVSIHCNASEDPEPNYIATYIQATGGEAEKLAQAVQNQMVKLIKWKDGGVKTANLALTRDTNMPAILCECGFISNPEQEQLLNDPNIQKGIAIAIVNGIINYAGLKEEVKSEMNLDQAIAILKEKGIISNSDYWKMAAQCVRYLDNLIISVANYIK